MGGVGAEQWPGEGSQVREGSRGRERGDGKSGVGKRGERRGGEG